MAVPQGRRLRVRNERGSHGACAFRCSVTPFLVGVLPLPPKVKPAHGAPYSSFRVWKNWGVTLVSHMSWCGLALALEHTGSSLVPSYPRVAPRPVSSSL